MKKIQFLIIAILLAISVTSAQTPLMFKYQAVLRDAGGSIVTGNHNITVKIYTAIDALNPTWTETHTGILTTAQGIINLNIGSVTSLTGIDWSIGNYFIGITIDAGTEMGRSQLLSVPYALYAKMAETADYSKLSNLPELNIANWNTAYNWGNHTELYKPLNYVPNWSEITNKPTQISDFTLNANNNTITNVARPINNNDAANKAYVDELLDRIEILEGTAFRDTRDGNVYKMVTIGSQVWMAENLRYLPSVTHGATGSFFEPVYYVFGYMGSDVGEAKATENYSTYGVLYNWFAAMNGAAGSSANPSGVQGVCPTGWHLPSDAEWGQLMSYLGTNAGGKLKETGTVHWISPNTDATNDTQFTALPGGYRSYNIGFENITKYCYFWTTTAHATIGSNTWCRTLTYQSGVPNYAYTWNESGLTVRCIKN